MWFLPMWPSNTGAYFFTPEESEMAQYRAKKDAGGVSEDDEGTHWGGVVLAAKDPFTWMFSSLHFAIIIGQSFKDFFPSILDTFGFSEVGTYLLQAPPYIFAYMVTITVSWSSGRMVEHCYHIIGSMAVCAVGTIILISTLVTGPRYFGLFLLCSGPFVALNLHLSWETAVVPRPRTKRAALIAIANCASSVTHWFTPYFYLTNQAPRYETGGGDSHRWLCPKYFVLSPAPMVVPKKESGIGAASGCVRGGKVMAFCHLIFKGMRITGLKHMR